MLESKTFSLAFRTICLFALIAITPFGIIGMYNENKYGGIFFFVAILIFLVPEIFIKVFLKPISATFKNERLMITYYLRKPRILNLTEIKGFRLTEEPTRYENKKGVVLYLADGGRIYFTEINIKDVKPLIIYLKLHEVVNYGVERIKPWFSPRNTKRLA